MRLSTRIWKSLNLKTISIGFLVVAGIIVFALAGVDSRSMNQNIAARVGSQTISSQSLGEAVRQLNQQAGSEIDDATRRANIERALNELIQEKVLVEEAFQIGWGATDLEVAQWIRNVPIFQNEKTKQFDKAAYQKFIKSGQMSELDLYRRGRESIAQQKLLRLFQFPGFVPKAMAQEELKRDGTEFDLEFAEIKPNEDVLKSAAAEEAKKYAANPDNQAKLKEAYEAAKSEFVHKPQVRIRTLLVSHKNAQRAQGDALQRSEEEARALADKLHAQAKSGADFSKLAAQTNDDLTAKANGGDLGWVDDGALDPESTKAAFALTKENRLSSVLATPFGFRVIYWEDSRPAVEKSLDDVKNDLALRAVSPEIRQKLKADLQKEVSEALAAKDNAKLEEVLAKHKLAWQKLGKPFTPGLRFVPELGVADPLLRHVFSLKQKGDLINQVLDFNGRTAVVRLAARREAPASTDEKLAEARKREGAMFAQSFYLSSQRKLFEIYNRNKDIERNAALLR